MSPPALRRYRAERLLREEFAALRSKVLGIVRSQLRAKGVTLNAADLEACYAQAWHGLYAAVLEGEEIESPSAWLVLVTFRRAIDESRSASRVGAQADGSSLFEVQAGASSPDLAAEIDDRARLRQVFEGLRTRLSKRECEAASLCYLQGLSRAEAASQMGISEMRMRKLMEGQGAGRPGVAGKMGELLGTIRDGGWCEQQSSLIRAYALGVLEPGGERHTLAVAHCRDCPACRAHVASLRGLAAVLPLPLFSPFALAGKGATGTGAAGAGSAAKAGVGPTRAAMGIGRGATGSAWSGLGGSLAAKLAVTAMVMLGAGYAVLGSRAHGSQPAGRAVIAPEAIASETLSHAPFAGLSAGTRRSRRVRRSPIAPQRSSPTRTARSTGEASGREFLPERARAGAPVVSSTATPTASHNSRAAPEFGIE